MKRSDEMDITIRVAVDSDFLSGTPASADGVDPPVDAEVDLQRVEWIHMPGVDIRRVITREQFENIQNQIEDAVEMGR